jgi:hypothetical protein
VRKIDELVDRIAKRVLPADGPATMTAAERREVVAKVVEEARKEKPEFVGNLVTQLQAFEKTLHLIYSRYKSNPDKTAFRNKVERLTLINMMLLHQKELGFGKVLSNLFQLLLDLIQNTDPKEPDATKFLRDYSLTLYFDDAKLDDSKRGNGYAALKTTLEIQADESLRNVVSFVSELRGVKHLLDKLKTNKDAEVIVVNATADEFLKWVTNDNLNATYPGAKGRLRCGRLLRRPPAAPPDAGDPSDRVAPPALVYLTDSAFGGNPSAAKAAWFQNNAGFQLQQVGASVIFPPVCVSTSEADWETEGANLLNAARNFPAPVVVLGPSPQLNSEKDSFRTFLPAGYLFAAHLLGAPQQGVVVENQIARSAGRFRKIGYSTASMRDSLSQTVWGEEGDAYQFAADFYLYLILQVLGTGVRSGVAAPPDVDVSPASFYSCFYFRRDNPKVPADEEVYKTTAALDRAVFGNQALRFSLADKLAPGAPLSEVFVATGPDIMLIGDPKHAGMRRMADVAWFNRSRLAAGLP